jgi:uncharacterized protein (DUF1919 family)
MEKYTFISNNCIGSQLYGKINREYDNPFMGSYFQSDYQFLKFCKNYYYYISCEPVFKEPILPFDTEGPVKPGTFPNMFLDDIEINWIHETDEKECIEKYNRRIKRGINKTPFFIWGDSLLHQEHTTEKRLKLIEDFENINNTFYIRKDSHERWKKCSFKDRNPGNGFANPVPWIDFELCVNVIIDYFNNIRKDADNIIYHVYALCYNESRLLSYFLNHYKNADRIIVLDNESTDNSVDIIKSFGREVITFTSGDTFDDILHQNIKNTIWKNSKESADFVIVQDLDEFVHFPDYPYSIKNGLLELKKLNTNFVYLKGYEMVCTDEEFDNIPNNDQIYKYINKGFYASNYSKPNLINPKSLIETNWEPGSHQINPIPNVLPTEFNVLLLHYKHIGFNHEINRRKELRIKKNNDITDKNKGYSVEYTFNDDELNEYTKKFYINCKDINNIIDTRKILTISTVENIKGLYGGLGNQLFNIFTCLSLSYKYNLCPVFLSTYKSKKYLDNLYRNLEFNNNLNVQDFVKIEETDNELNFINKNNYHIQGYFQSSKYFDKYREEILKIIKLNINDEIVVENYINKLRNMFLNKTLIGIHIRRNDYKDLNWILPIEYYKKSINNFDQNCEFICFSDDKEWCKNYMKPFFVCDENFEDYIELFILSKMDGIIMANSTFSWWAAYIGNIKKAICPYPWFKTEIYNKYIYQKHWFQITY